MTHSLPIDPPPHDSDHEIISPRRLPLLPIFLLLTAILFLMVSGAVGFYLSTHQPTIDIRMHAHDTLEKEGLPHDQAVAVRAQFHLTDEPHAGDYFHRNRHGKWTFIPAKPTPVVIIYAPLVAKP